MACKVAFPDRRFVADGTLVCSKSVRVGRRAERQEPAYF